MEQLAGLRLAVCSLWEKCPADIHWCVGSVAAPTDRNRPSAAVVGAPTTAVRPTRVTCWVLQLELANMLKNGDLQSMWTVARQTDLTFNLVGGCCRALAPAAPPRRGGGGPRAGVG